MKKFKALLGKGKGGASNAPAATNESMGYFVKEKDLPKIHKAAWTGDIAKVKQLAKKDSNLLDKENRSPLHLACARGHDKIVQELLEWKAHANIGDNLGKTPLMKAVECGHSVCVRLLLEYHADVDASDAEGNSALHLAVQNGHAETVRAIIKAGAKLNTKNKMGYTPLHFSIKHKRDELTQILLESNADPNISDRDYRTPLHHACNDDAINHVKLLLQYNANTAMKDVKGWTAEDCAMMRANHGCSQLVYDHNLKQQKTISRSMPATPRSGSSLPPSSLSTPRPDTQSDFGMPQLPKEDGYDSDDPTISKGSVHDERQDSWGDNTDISSALDDHRDKAPVRTSVAKHVNLDDSDEEELKTGPSQSEGSRKSPGPRPGSGDIAGTVRPVYSRTPTPDGTTSPIDRPDSASGLPGRGTPSKIPLKKTVSGASGHTSAEEFTDEEDDEPQPIMKNRVSFKQVDDIKNISIEDDSDAEDDEEVEPTKKRRIETPEEATGYLPPGVSEKSPSELSKEKIRAMMKDLGLEDVSDVSEDMDSESYASPHDTSHGGSSQPTTPRGILKAPMVNAGKPPSVQQPLESDDDDWDSTQASDVENRSHPKGDPHKGLQSPEYDSDLEGTLNPENSHVEKTSQWDSTEEAYTPRTPRDNVVASPDVVDFDEEEEEEKEVSVQDQINDAVTSFGVKPTNQSPELGRDTPSTKSHDSRETPTFSTGLQRTVIEAVVMEPSPRDNDQDDMEEEDKDSDWDSEDEVHSGMESPVPEVANPADTPRTPRGQTTSTVSDPESPSEWEIEKEKLKEEEQRRRIEAEKRQQTEIESKRQREEREQKEAEEREILAEIAAEEDHQRAWDEEQKRLAELEEEEERQRQWEEDERQRQEQIRKEAAEELERERRSQNEESDVSDFSDDGHNHFEFDHHHHQQQQQDDFSDGPSQKSERSQHSEVNIPPARLDKGRPLAGLTSPRMPELKQPPPKLVVSAFLTASKDSRKPVEEGEVENESPAPIYENLVISSSPGANLYSSPALETHIITPPSSNRYAPMDNPTPMDNQEAESDVGVEDIAEEEVDDELEEEIEPVLEQHLKALNGPLQRSVPPGNRAQSNVEEELQLLGTPPPLPTSEPPGPHKPMSLRSDGNSADEDDLDELDHLNNKKSQGRSSLIFPPEFSGTTGLYMSGLDVPFDDDGLSVTSTENGDISSSYRPENLPYGKDMLVNMNLNDSSAVLKLQEHLREHRKQLEHERNQKSLLENKHKLMVKEKAQMQKSIDSLKYHKSSLEQTKLDLEAKIRNLEYNVNQEEALRQNAELLLKKTKEQLEKKEEQVTQEMEAKQRAELSMRNVQMELRSAQNTIREIEEEKVELERKLANEKKGRELQEKLNDEQQRFQQHMHEESLKTSSQREEAKSALELADDSIKYNKELVEKYKNETIALKAELQRQRQRLTDENCILSADVEKMSAKIEDLKGEVRLNEEALTQLTLRTNLQQNNLVGENTQLGHSLDKERVAREKTEAELESARSRLQVTTAQLEKAQQARNEFERRLHGDREEWARQLERKDQELEALKEKLATVMHTLNSTETKLNAVENELQISNTTLLERTNQQQQAHRDLQYYKTAQENHDANLRHEKEQNAKLQGKIENLQERVSGLQHDNLSLKQQLETAQTVANDRSGLNLQDKLNSMIANLKADHDKARASLEDKNNSLQDTISRLRDEVRNSENRRSSLEQDLRKANQDQTDLIRKLSIAEASLEVANKARDSLEQDRQSLKLELEQVQSRYHSAQERTIEAQTRVQELVGKLDKTEQSRLLSNQQLADTSATITAFNSSKAELEENYQKLQVENVRLDAELKHEKQKTEMLNRDLLDSQKVRSSLEALCSNLKSTNAHLEEKLGPEQLREVTASIAQLERHKQETATQLEEEKRKTRKALEQKRLAESKLESEQERCSSLQKEVANLKAYLKVAKKKLKALDTNENRVSNLHSAFDKERQAMEEMLVSVKSQSNVETGFLDKTSVEESRKELEARYRLELNRKLDEVNSYLEDQARARQRLDSSREEQETKLRQEKRKLEEELTDVRIKYEQSMAQRETKELEAKRYRDLYESEMQWRMRLTEQLYSSTDKAFGLKSKLVAERQRNRMFGSLNNLSANGHTLELSRINGSLGDDALSSKLRAELDRSIAKHLEAAPHDQFRPVLRGDDPVLANSNFAKANAEYYEVLKRKYCV